MHFDTPKFSAKVDPVVVVVGIYEACRFVKNLFDKGKD